MSSNSAAHKKVLVVGVGSIGERHVRCFQQTGRAVVSICEVDNTLRDAVGQKYSVERRYSRLESALEEPHDAAVIAVPADSHIAVARQTLSAGLHLLVEKPLSTSIRGVSELAAAIGDTDRVAAVGYVYRAHPALDQMRQAISSGQFGRPVQVVVTAGQNFPSYRPTYAASYYANRARGGGAIQDAMTHLVNAVEWLVGPTTRVVADAEHLLLPGVEVEDTVHFLARHGKLLASYSLNQFQSPNEVIITIVCERGTARFEYHNHRWRYMIEPDSPWCDHPPIELERDTLFIRQANSFLDAIDGSGYPLCEFHEGVQSLQVNLALLSSVATGCWQFVETVDCTAA